MKKMMMLTMTMKMMMMMVVMMMMVMTMMMMKKKKKLTSSIIITEWYIMNSILQVAHHQHPPKLAPAGRPEQLRRGPAAELRGPAVDDVLPENGDEGNPGCRLFVGARLALRHCRLGPSGGDSLIEKDWERWGRWG